jgi:hypothetical protein
MAPEPWTDEENDAIVADYFSMLSGDLSGHRVNKTEHRNALMQVIHRSTASVEFKHRNISAVMDGFGQPWLSCKPALSNSFIPTGNTVFRKRPS